MASLDQYLSRSEHSKLATSHQSEQSKDWEFKPVFAQQAGQSFFVGAGYDGEKRLVFLKLYDPASKQISFWYDNTGHVPYCISKESEDKLRTNHELTSHPGLIGFEPTEKYDALAEKEIPVTIIRATDPLSIGGRPSGSIRDIIKAWEADIRYVENYIYDRRLEPGMSYNIDDNGNLVQQEQVIKQEEVQKIFGGTDKGYHNLIASWLRLLEYPLPAYLRAGFDIEVHSPIDTRMPDPANPEYEVIAAALSGSDNKRKVFLLSRKNIEANIAESPKGATVEFYNSERELLSGIFTELSKYPFILTFNGDDFDLRYLYNRALKIGINREQIPIELGRDSATFKHGIHLDLYRFFFNRSVQVYAFNSKYREITLDAISEALLEEHKFEIETHVSKLSYNEIAAYCFQDADLVLRLSSFDDELVMKLATALSRISSLPMEDMSRQGVMGWIRSMMFREHRLRNYLIPRHEEITSAKGSTSTRAIIKGKKYLGGMVVAPVPGVHFGVAVLDFASLYPSIMKAWNLGYETVECLHEEDRSNIIPGTTHWVCTKKKGMESQLIGSLRDVRIKWYKPRSKDRRLPNGLVNWYSVVQNALKVVLNASYGVFGSDRFALYCPPVAESTAAVGRYAITRTIEHAKELGIEVFYGDTDSLFLGTPDKSKLDELIQWSKRELGMELEVDKVYRYVALSIRKKNYLGVHSDNRVDIKGLTGKKRHIPEFIKIIFQELIQILGQVQSQEDFANARIRIRDLVQNSYAKLRDRKYSLDELAFNMMIGKSVEHYTKTTPQHVKAAQQLSEKGEEVKAGDLVTFVKVRGPVGVKPVQLANKQEIDVEKYEEYMRSTFDQVLDAIGLDYDELTGAKKLESFF